MTQHTPFKYAWRLPPYDNRTFESLIRQFSQHPDVCDEVWLFMSEPTSYGYHPLKQVEELCRTIQKQMDAFRALGIRAGINLWPTFGAQDVGCDPNLRPPMPFPHMVGYDGSPAPALACPSSPEFLSYIREKFHIMAKARPDFIWVDDDCRLTHMGSPYPCFCQGCVARFQNGRFGSRKELVTALNQPENAKLRREWCAYNADRLANFCKTVRAAVDEVDPSIETPFMSVGYSHTTYSGDYLEKCAAALRAKAFRPGHGFYWDDRPRELFSKTMDIARQVQRLPIHEDILMEEESHPRIPLDKANAIRILEIGASLGAGCNGIAFNHLFKCSGSDPAFYLEEEMKLLHQCRPMFQRFNEFARELPMAGIWPIDNEWKMAGMEVEEDGWFQEDKRGYGFDTADNWATYGFALSADPEHAYANLLHGRMVETFSDDQIQALFEKPVLMDHEALAVLEKRGLSHLAGATLGKTHEGIEEVLTDHPLNGEFKGSSRSPLFASAHDLLPLPGWTAEELAYNQGPYGVRFGVSTLRMTKEGRAPVVIFGHGPYRFIGSPGKLCQMQGLVEDMGAPLLLCPQPGTFAPGRVTPFFRTDGKRGAAVLINASFDPAKQLNLELKLTGEKATLLRMDHPESVLPCVRKKDRLVIPIGQMNPWEMWMILVE